jgi:hypothetical protein
MAAEAEMPSSRLGQTEIGPLKFSLVITAKRLVEKGLRFGMNLDP